jgi:two-component system, OmpR family, sensor kinase
MMVTAQRPPGRARRWLAGRTLRARLIAGLLALLALACATVGLVTYTHLHSVLIDQLDTELTSASLRYSGCYSPRPPGDDEAGPPDPSQSPGHGQPPSACAQQQMTAAFTAVISQNKTVSDPYLAGRSGPCNLVGTDAAAVASVPVGRFVTVDLSHYGLYRLTATQTDDGIVVTGLPLAPVTQTLREVAIAELAVFLAALVITGVIGTAWVRFSLRPLRRVAATATGVTQLPLGSGEVSMPERVPDANPATEVGQVGAAFNRMLGHVEAALARREASESRLRTFAADASHELRTPLTAIRGYAELARRRSGALPEDVAHALSRVESEASRMSELVDELLLLARLDAGRPLATESVDLTRLVIDATSDARLAAAEHRWQLDLPEQPVIVRGDEQRLRQVLANLLSNAARHTPAGTAVTVALTTRLAPGDDAGRDGAPGGAGQGGKSDRATAAISVTDTGPGIPAALQPDVFERFVRGDTSRSRAAGSSGLGLAIVHAVTAAHGGTADLTSRPGRTTFTITLPVGSAD